MGDVSASRRERVSLQGLQARLTQLSAQPMPDRSTSQMHIYFSRSLGYWLRVSRHGNLAEISFYPTCPCEG